MQTFYRVSSTLHEKYSAYAADYDIAVIRLPTALTYSDAVQPVCLPRTPVADYSYCVVTGWGVTKSTQNGTCYSLQIQCIYITEDLYMCNAGPKLIKIVIRPIKRLSQARSAAMRWRWKVKCRIGSQEQLIIIIIIISNYIKVRPKASRAGFVCRTYQYFQRQRLTYTCRLKTVKSVR